MLEKILNRIVVPLYSPRDREIWERIQCMEMREIREDKLPTDTQILISLPFMNVSHYNYPHFSYIYSNLDQNKFIAKSKDTVLQIDIQPEGEVEEFINTNKELIKEEGRVSFFSDEMSQIFTVDSLSSWRDGEVVSESFVVSTVL